MYRLSSSYCSVVWLLLLLFWHHTALAFFPLQASSSTTITTAAATRKLSPTIQIIKTPVRRNQHSYESRISLLLLDNQQQQRSSLYAAAPSSHNNNYDEKYNGPALRIARCFPNLSRRKAEEAVVKGRVKVDGNVVVTPSYRLVGGQKLTLDDRKIHWESKAIALNNEGASSSTNNTNNRQQTTSNKKKKTKNASSSSSSLYYKYHKPVGVTCTMDKHDRRGLFYALPSKLKKLPLFPVGRLDLDSEGLVFLTNDGPLADAMLQPMYKQEKEYIVEVRPRLSVTQIAELAAGVLITTVQQRGGKETTKLTQPCHVEEIVNTNPQQSSPSSSFLLRFVLVEGRNRQIRKMVHAVSQQQQHHEVVSLKRIRQGVLSLGKLPSGTILPLQDKERNELFALVNK